MGPFRRAGETRVNAFPVGERYLFRHYFESDAVFDRLREYYQRRRYRFAVPPAEFPAVRSFLADRGYALVLVDDVAPFVVVVEAYTDHPEDIFSDAVARTSTAEYNYFLLADREAVERTVAAGATRLEDTSLDNPFA